MSTPTSAAEARARFLEVLFPDPLGRIEVRLLPSGHQLFVDHAERAELECFVEMTSAVRAENVYVGVAARGQADSGALSNCVALWAVFIDGDFKTTPQAELERRLAEFPFPPTMIVSTGGGWHVYWGLQEPLVLPADTGMAYRLLRGLAQKFGGDRSAAEPARILRLPGTRNFKYEPPRAVVLEGCEPTRRYLAEDLEQFLPLPAEDLAPSARFVIPAAIPEKTRAVTLYRLARSLKTRGLSAAEVLAAVQVVNRERCQPPLDDREVVSQVDKAMTQPDRPRSVGGDAPPPRDDADWDRRETQAIAAQDETPDPGHQAAGAPPRTERARPASPWAAAVPAPDYIASSAEELVFLDPDGHFLARGVVTEWFSPRGLGKTNIMLELAVGLARGGLKVLLIDRDNPRREIRRRLRAMGAGRTPSLKIIDRAKAPPLTDREAWAAFPVADYDVVIIDSLDSSSEGVGEQDSAKPSRALGAVLDVVRADGGPGALILGNVIKSGAHGRGSGVIEDRADIAYEVRDVTDFTPTGKKPWVEEIPDGGRANWAARSGRRQKRPRYRLAFIPSKFRVGEEPEPFVLEVRHDTEPWSVVDVTAEMLTAGREAREAAEQTRQHQRVAAVGELVAEVARRAAAEDPIRVRPDAEDFLMDRKLSRKAAREAIEEGDGTRWVIQTLVVPHARPRVLVPMPETPGKDGSAARVEGAADPHEHRASEQLTLAARMETGRPELGLANPAPDAGSGGPQLWPRGVIITPDQTRSAADSADPNDPRNDSTWSEEDLSDA